MQSIFLMNKINQLILFACLFTRMPVYAQIESQTYSFQQSDKYSDIIYNTKTRFHTSIRPFLFKNELLDRKDSLESANMVDSDICIMRKLFNEHLVWLVEEDHYLYL